MRFDRDGRLGQARRVRPDRYHYREHRDYLFALWNALDLGDRVTLVLHDWGSALGFDWANQIEVTVPGVHFVQEDSPDEIGRAVGSFVRAIRAPAPGAPAR